MPKIPQYYSKEPARVGSPRQMPLNLFALPWQEMERTGTEIAGLGERINEVARFSEYTQKSNEYDAGLLDLVHKYENDPEIHEKREEIKKAVERFKNEKIAELKDPYVHRRLAPVFSKLAKYKLRGLENIANRRQIDVGRSQFLLNLSKKEELYWKAASDLEAAHTLGEIKAAIFGAAQAGLITQTDAAKMWAETPSRLAFQEVLYDMDTEGAEKTLERLEAGEYEELKPDHKVQLTRTLRQEIGYEKAKLRESEAIEKEAEEERITNIQNDFIAKLSKDPIALTVEDIIASDLPPVGMGSKDFFIKALNRHNDAITKEKADPFMVSDPKARAEMVDAVNADPVTIKKDEILAKMGDGLSTKDTEHFLREWRARVKKTDKPMKSEVFRWSLKAFDDAYKSGIFGEKGKETSYEEYYKTKNKFERIVMEGKVTPTGGKREFEPKEIEELTSKMLFPHKKKLFDGVWERFLEAFFIPHGRLADIILEEKEDRLEWHLIPSEQRIGDIDETIKDVEPRKSDPFPGPVVDAIRKLHKQGLSIERIDEVIVGKIEFGELPTWKMGITEPERKEVKKRPPERGIEKLPPASEHEGEIWRNLETGERHQSDGEKWGEIK